MIYIIAIDHYLDDILEPLDRDDILSVIVSCRDNNPDVSDLIVEKSTNPSVKGLLDKSKLLLSMKSIDKNPYIEVRLYKEVYVFYQAPTDGKEYIILPSKLVKRLGR